jgi:hypothetical protein
VWYLPNKFSNSGVLLARSLTSFFQFVRWDFGYCGHYWPIVPAPGDRWGWLWRNWWYEDWQEKPKYSEETYPSATLSTTNPTWLDPGLNPARHGGKPATNFFFCSGLWGYWRCGHSWPIVPASSNSEDDCGEIGGMKIGRENRSSWRKPAPAPLLSVTKSHMTRPGFEPGPPRWEARD